MRKILAFAALVLVSNYAVAQNSKSSKEMRNKKTAMAAFNAMQEGDMDALFKHYHKQVAWSGNGAEKLRPVQLDSFKMNTTNYRNGWKEAFPDDKQRLMAVAAEGDYVMAYLSSSGTWKNKYGIWEASGKPYSMNDVVVFKFNNEGKIIEQQHIMPQIAVMDQVGEGAEFEMNKAGYALLAQKKFEEAIEVFQMNVKLYPKSSNVYDSLGEAYAAAGNKEKAIENYQRSVELDPDNENGKVWLMMLKKQQQ